MSTDLSALYADHLQTLCARADAALAAGGFDHLLIPAGVEKYRFLDDMPYPFAANPHFKAWVPLTDHPHCWIAYTPGRRPVLAYHQPDDYWHLPPQDPSGFWAAHFDIRVLREPADALRHLPTGGRAAIIGEADAALGPFVPNNPAAVMNPLHFHRGVKTPYELARLRTASARAVRGHRAAEAAFRAGASELDIHRAYLAATGHTDATLPYGNIVALNAHGAVLHYQHLRAEPPAQSRAFLIDAGASDAGYAADITRTYGNGDARFEALVAAVDTVQQALCARVQPGVDYRALHLDCHLALAGILQAQDIVRMTPESMVETGVSATFFPHGLGHLLGLQVHDVGGFMAGEHGGHIDRPDGHPFLRLTRVLQDGMVVTIEPGLYFIGTLLARLKAGPHGAAVHWDAVEQLRPFGGVRIEDDVVCRAGTPENLTRDAFARAS